MSRVLLRSLAALVLTAAAGLIGWRVLAPAEVLSTAATPNPASSVSAAQVTGRTNMAPLIVDESMRVYAGKRQVRADGPVDAKSVNTARWSLRRWPAQVSGVVAAGPTVISRWSDGVLIAVDGRTGKELWRVATGLPAPEYAGHRTGAATVWAPVGLRVTGDVVVVDGVAYGVSDGTSRPVPVASPSAGAATPVDGTLLGLSRGRPVVLTAARHLRVMSPDGRVMSEFPLAVGTEKLTWKPGLWQVTDDWVAIERLTGDGPADPEAPEHYFTTDTVIIASLK
ncbi:PQQ-binding-like beta-propeller repeat protein [Paractinoplanes lichenicola]|uniref:PQQ-binding-like beta-propeller repeat protein n=1 Tax=Paractinoplanes lichenicola TaxID=2802976 RepID=A0ABS1VM07_9ACTN|nr:PQQ-binding-like beta-propeller repeat protein [Actinoplanes lichenicola]MBL7254521.1 PQQ-binding-like beta-propeller repeat protein [Actinoplanes lichenicola]